MEFVKFPHHLYRWSSNGTNGTFQFCGMWDRRGARCVHYHGRFVSVSIVRCRNAET